MRPPSDNAPAGTTISRDGRFPPLGPRRSALRVTMSVSSPESGLHRSGPSGRPRNRTTTQADVLGRRPRGSGVTKSAVTRPKVSSEMRPTSVWTRARWIVKSFRGRTSLCFGNRPSAISRSSNGIASRRREIFEVTPQTMRSSPWTMSTRAGRRLTAERSVKGNETVTSEPGRSANRISPHTRSQTSSSASSQRSLRASSVARSNGANSSFRIPSTSAFLRRTRASPDSRSTRSVSRPSRCFVRTSLGITIWPLLDTLTTCTDW